MKHLCVILLVFTAFYANGQKENGIVYSEHEAIQKTRAAWDAMIKGDKEALTTFYTDTIQVYTNGVRTWMLKKNLGKRIEYWQQFDKLAVRDDKPASPDALVLKDGTVVVQDWVRLSGVHKATGVRFDLPIHNVYLFNAEGKVRILSQYYNEEILKEVDRSQLTRENGKVYINHPLIVTVRKIMNAYSDEDLEQLSGYYAPTARFYSLSNKYGKFLTKEAKMAENKAVFADNSDFTFVQDGYPDCIYYDDTNSYSVYSWWILSVTGKDGKKRSNIPLMMTHQFDKDGKVTGEWVYLSTNLLE